MNSQSERRDFNRYPIEFMVEVAAEDSEGEPYRERSMLKDISGGGASFITQKASKYFPGQSLELTIFMPGTNEVKAHVRGKAKVVRKEGHAEKGGGVNIAVTFDDPLHFERLDVKTQPIQ